MTTAPLSRADRALLGATLLCAAVWSTYRLADPDTFLHLAIGRGIVQSRALPTVCEQTYIEPKPAYQDHEWLGQTALYLTEQVGERGLTPLVAAWRDPEAWPPLPAPAEQAGVIGLQLGVLAVVTLVGWLVWRTGRARGASVAAFVIVASLAIPTFRFRMVPRPHLATTLGTALFAYWLFSPSRRLWVRWGLLVAATVLWVNAHGGFLTGIVMIAIGAIAEGIRRVGQASPPAPAGAGSAAGAGGDARATELGRAAPAAPEAPPAGRAAPAAHTRPVTVALVSLVVVLFAGFANPYGAEAFVYPFRLMGAEYFRTHIAEWQPPDFSPYLWPFWLLIALAGGALVASSRRRDWAAIGLLLAFGYLALNSRRHLELFCVVSVPIIAAALTPGLARLEGILRLATIPRRRHAAVGLGLAGIALLTGAAWRTDELYRPGWGEHPRAFPVKAMDYALSRPGQGWLAEAQPHVLCDMSWSGYLAWRAPHARYFIDGRNLEFGAERYRLYADLVNGTQQSDVRILALTGLPIERQGLRAVSGAPWELADVMARRPSDPPFTDSRYGLFDAWTISPEGFVWGRHGWGLVLGDRFSLVHADDVCLLLTSNPRVTWALEVPFDLVVNWVTGRVSTRAERRSVDSDRRLLDDLLSGQESDFFRFTLAEISTDRHPEEAQDGYLRIARRSPSHWPSRARLGELLVRQGKPEEAVRWLREAVEIRPDIPELQYNLGHACGQIEDWKGADEAYAAVLEVQPESAMALANRAVALHNLGDDAGAGECIDRALALDPENPEFEATRRAIRGGK